MSLISLIILDDIEVPDGLKSKFDADKIDRAAQNIIALGGLIRPLVLQRLDYESYKLISGEFELAAMLRAQEIDKNKERVECFICGNNTLLGDLDETYLNEAVEIFTDSDKKDDSSKEVNENDGIELREQLQAEHRQHEESLAELKAAAVEETDNMKSEAFKWMEYADELKSQAVIECIALKNEKMDEVKQEIEAMKKAANAEIERLKREAQEKLIEERATERARLAGLYKPKANKVRKIILEFMGKTGSVSVKDVWLETGKHGIDFERRQVGQRLAYLNKKGLIRRAGRGVYELAK